ncbi:histidine--tRNA ligase [Selenomonas sputigena]|uniref:Histidine--tRNA ligase n=1 Tax=Selenomonas sputigena (strain ATCC 35185 / DSM 20758 / CCUG 44933 / VPI D19B-28) TaxID=546271 RepID=C9LW22_SELS3|nr:histidine--tRNA ligase [Selenomonas sputigena]EEX76925.1 histidine--tRNA ligase [Selenomonas sputigena ATCC 35185]
MLINGPRGTKDILPDTVAQWTHVEKVIRELCARYGYREIRTPIFEHTELFLRGIGETTDVVEKEMYTFTDRGERSLTLRPENTASVVRSYLQNKLYAADALVKLFYIGSMFRYDRPQAGRYREFHQFGVEALGEENPAVDAEIIVLAVEFLRALGLQELKLHLNSVGCPKCRPVYRERLQEFFRPHLEELCTDCRSRFERNPLRLLDCKNEHCHALAEGAPRITDCLCDECRVHFTEVQSYLTAAGIPFELDANLVRGLDYYTKTAFEVKYTPLGAQSAVAGGGRYDGLVEEVGGPPTPGIGFAVGLERVLLALEKQELLPEELEAVDVFVVALGEAAQIPAFKLLHELRAAKLSAAMDFAGRSMKAQMKQANKKNARFVAILGEDEVKEASALLKDMKTSEQKKLALKDFVPALCVEVKN